MLNRVGFDNLSPIAFLRLCVAAKAMIEISEEECRRHPTPEDAIGRNALKSAYEKFLREASHRATEPEKIMFSQVFDLAADTPDFTIAREILMAKARFEQGPEDLVLSFSGLAHLN